MNTIFVGGSRHVSRLPADIRKRLDNVVASGHHIVVGDANGADQAVQRHLNEVQYPNVTVFCSGDVPRNNLGSWTIRRVDAPKGAKGFHFYAAKDREMARKADFGLMIWDGKSPGTVLNVLRLVQAGKIAVLFNVPEKTALNVKSVDQYRDLIFHVAADVRADVRERATAAEWTIVEPDRQRNLLDSATGHEPVPPAIEDEPASAASGEAVGSLNDALASGDAVRIVESINSIALGRGSTPSVCEIAPAHEGSSGSPEAERMPPFATVIEMLTSFGLRLEAKAREPRANGPTDEAQSDRAVPTHGSRD